MRDVTIHPAAIGHPADCYGCQGTGRTIGFGHTGKTCPGHRAECEPGFCVCDDDVEVDSQYDQDAAKQDEWHDPDVYFGPDPWNDRKGDR
jgi:hypothetical protein